MQLNFMERSWLIHELDNNIRDKAAWIYDRPFHDLIKYIVNALHMAVLLYEHKVCIIKSTSSN